MLMNFSQINTPILNLYLSQDETDILVETEKLDREEKLYARIEEDMTLCNHM